MPACSKTLARRYRLGEPVGRGGMGTVWRARDDVLGRTVAVKQVTPPADCPADQIAAMCRMARNEARAASRVANPHVVRVYDLLNADGLPWIVMEYVASRTLHDVLAECGPRTPRAAAAIGLAVLDGLRAAHGAGIIHCDITPRNILLGHDGRVLLTDFGLARFIEDASAGPEPRGTAGYVAPERAYAGITTAAGDLWSLGAVLYTAVEGRAPHARGTAMETLLATATKPPDPYRRAGRLADVLDQLLRPDPSERPCVDAAERGLRALCAPSSAAGLMNRYPDATRRGPERPAVRRPPGGRLRPSGLPVTIPHRRGVADSARHGVAPIAAAGRARGLGRPDR